eukprot:1903-Heterococcus_DN1.PRE.2
MSQAEVDAGRWTNETTTTATTSNGTDASIGRTWPVTGSLNMSVVARYEGNGFAAINGSSIHYRITFRAKNSYSIERRPIDYVPTATLGSCCGRVPCCKSCKLKQSELTLNL